MNWCWLLGHRWLLPVGENVYRKPVFACVRCLKRKACV